MHQGVAVTLDKDSVLVGPGRDGAHFEAVRLASLEERHGGAKPIGVEENVLLYDADVSVVPVVTMKRVSLYCQHGGERVHDRSVGAAVYLTTIHRVSVRIVRHQGVAFRLSGTVNPPQLELVGLKERLDRALREFGFILGEEREG